MAAEQLETEWLQRWWCKKYNRPRKDPVLATYTIEEIYVEFMEDIIEKDPQEAFPPVTEDGKVLFMNTGDKLIDKWEKQISEGKQPTFEDDFAESAEVKAWLTAKKPKEEDMPPDIHDDFRKR